ncbi:P-loop containing nucleoside triphosphate hydrolase protein [Violaceomyces palustris]|uniref:P-loop containing nucleoside triphosphate hydrolase protein n=1 Tax=Violaceomyces palustris TaxID=1673888 RepID=A0ACD0NZ73_9BASI|nr:P-loop containing nucleoside triphosphate hydrolase protein [Violaceomyces palustris]
MLPPPTDNPTAASSPKQQSRTKHASSSSTANAHKKTSSNPKSTGPTIDALTANLETSKLGDPTPAEAVREFDFQQNSIKQLLLQPIPLPTNSSAEPNQAGKLNNPPPPSPGIPSDKDRVEQGGTTVGSDEVLDEADLPSYLIHKVNKEGGEFILRIGGKDDQTGRPMSLTEGEMDQALENLKVAASMVDCQTTLLVSRIREEDGERLAHVMVRRIPASAQELLELRVAVIGNVDAGKSTTLGVLTKGGLDDGRGRARVNLFRHKHEVESGRTSSVGMEIMGFDSKGVPVVEPSPSGSKDDPGRRMTWEEVCAKAAKVISFIDLAGHERYLKTTVFGMTGCLPDFVMLMVGANAGLIGMSKEHLGIALALSVPVIVCITKVDMTPAHILEATIKQLTKILKSPGCRKTPVFIRDMSDVVETALRIETERVCPVFQISNVTGQQLDLLRGFLNALPQASSAKFDPRRPFEFQISDTFSVPFVGTVVSGVVVSGRCKVGDSLLIGPDSLGQFSVTSVRSIQRKRVNVEVTSAGQSASFALKRIRKNQVRKGMVMLSRSDPAPKAHMEFEAEILCLYHSTTLSVGSCMVLHAASIRQTVRIVAIAKIDSTAAAVGSEKPVVRTGDRARLRLQFLRFPEYVKPGMKLITRE